MRVNRLVFYCMGALAGAALAMSMSLPWPVLGIGLLVVTAILAIRGLVKATRTPLAQGTILFFSMSLAMTILFALVGAGVIATWPERWAYEQCQSQAQTVSDRDACTEQLNNDTQSRITDLLRPGR